MSAELITALQVLLVIALAVILNLIARRSLRSLANAGYLTPQGRAILSSVCKWTFIVASALLCLHILGISVTTIWASLSAMLVLVAVALFAMWSILSNASCAVFLVVFAPFRIGDEIEIMEPSVLDPTKSGLRGKVIDISLLYTTLLEADEDESRTLIRMPNNIFFQKAIRCRRGKNTKSLKQALFRSPD